MNLQEKNCIYTWKLYYILIWLIFIYIYRTFKHILILAFNAGDAIWWVGCLPIIVFICSCLITSVFGIWYWTNKHDLSISNCEVLCKQIDWKQTWTFLFEDLFFLVSIVCAPITSMCTPYVHIRCPMRIKVIGSPWPGVKVVVTPQNRCWVQNSDPLLEHQVHSTARCPSCP